MSAPRILIQIAIAGAQIFGKALFAAGRQAVKNAQHRPQDALAGDAAGVRNATSGSIGDRLTRDHRMTLDEAQQILNVKGGDPIDVVLRNYEHMFKANSPLPPPEGPSTGRQTSTPFHSHYLQSKVFRARERIEAELKAAQEEAPASESSQGPPPPPPESGR